MVTHFHLLQFVIESFTKNEKVLSKSATSNINIKGNSQTPIFKSLLSKDDIANLKSEQHIKHIRVERERNKKIVSLSFNS